MTTEWFLSTFYRYLWNSRIQAQIPTCPFQFGAKSVLISSDITCTLFGSKFVGKEQKPPVATQRNPEPIKGLHGSPFSSFRSWSVFPYPALLRRTIHIASLPLNRAKAMSLFSGDNELLRWICWFSQRVQKVDSIQKIQRGCSCLGGDSFAM